jgi:4-carboxymuconolactone decarboxylase
VTTVDGGPAYPAEPPRLGRLLPDSLDEHQRAVYDAITGGPRARGPRLFPLTAADGGLAGPFNAFLLQPRLGNAVQALGSAVRYETALGDRAREIAILVVAVANDSAFEWQAHAAIGAHAGLTDSELAAVRAGEFGALPPGPEQVVARTGHALATGGDLDDESYELAVAALGEPGLFELLTLVGYYAMLAMQLRVFRVGPPTA